MSTILDALRKLQRDRERASPPQDLHGSVVQDLYPPPRRISRLWLTLTGIVAGLGAAGFTALVLLHGGTQLFGGGESLDAEPETAALSPPQPAPRSPAAEPAATPGLRAARARSSLPATSPRVVPGSEGRPADPPPAPAEGTARTARLEGRRPPAGAALKTASRAASPSKRSPARGPKPQAAAARPAARVVGSTAPPPAQANAAPTAAIATKSPPPKPEPGPRLAQAEATQGSGRPSGAGRSAAGASQSRAAVGSQVPVVRDPEPESRTGAVGEEAAQLAVRPAPSLERPSVPHVVTDLTEPPRGGSTRLTRSPETAPAPAGAGPLEPNPFLQPLRPAAAAVSRSEAQPRNGGRPARFRGGSALPSYPFPPLELESVRWHPDPERRSAELLLDGARTLIVHEGESVLDVQVYRIEPDAIELRRGTARERLSLAP